METKQKLCLIAQNLESDGNIFYTIDNRQFHYQTNFNKLDGRRIQACFYGWVILSEISYNYLWSLWNPLTSKFFHLPTLITNKKTDHYECCLSSHPEEKGSLFLLFSSNSPTIFICQLDAPKKRLIWIEKSYDDQRLSLREGYGLLQSPTSCNGKVYAFVSRSYKSVIYVEIIVKGKEAEIHLWPLVTTPRNHPWALCPSIKNADNVYPFLKGYYEDLFYIEVGFRDKTRKTIGEVTLFKLDTTRFIKWIEMIDLKDAAFFIVPDGGYFTCYYNYVVDSELAGYMHLLSECGKNIYSYHVKDRTISLFSLPVQVCEIQESAWAMLELRLKVEENNYKDTKIVVRPPVKDEFDSATSESHSHLLNMPLHILELIMKFCIGVEYMNLRATCKHCCLAAPIIQWSNKSRELRRYSLNSPWLMVLDNYQDVITFIDPMHGDRYYIRTPQELKGGYEIHYAKYGWLLMHINKGKRQLVFFNPFTSNILELPEVQNIGNYCFSAPPTSPNCIVIGFSKVDLQHVFIHFVSEESRWYRFSLTPSKYRTDSYYFSFSTPNGVCFRALHNNEGIECFSYMNRNGDLRNLVANKAPRRSQAQYFMSSCDQHLLLVIVSESKGSVEVFKVNESTKKCEKINDLGKHMIYISNSSSFCLEAKSPEMANKIYFPRLLHDDDKKIVFYSLETCRYHTFNDKKIQKNLGAANLSGTKYFCHPHAWIEPSWST